MLNGYRWLALEPILANQQMDYNKQEQPNYRYCIRTGRPLTH